MRLLLLVSLCFLLCACAQQIENPRTINPAQPSVDALRSRELQRAQLPDVPVPGGFEFVDRGNRSFSYTQGGVRIAELQYWGRASVADVVTFYRSTMGLSAYGWTAGADAAAEAGHALAFSKERSACTVDVRTGNGGTVIEIHVSGAANSR